MKLFIALTFFVVITLTIVIGVIQVLNTLQWGTQPHLSVVVRDDLMPGSHLPTDHSCSLGFGSLTTLLCYGDADQQILVDYNDNTGIINYAEYDDGKDYVGTLLSVWGRPNGFICNGRGEYTFYWNDRFAVIKPKYGLSLYSLVERLDFGSPMTDYIPWHDDTLIPYTCGVQYDN